MNLYLVRVIFYFASDRVRVLALPRADGGGGAHAAAGLLHRAPKGHQGRPRALQLRAVHGAGQGREHATHAGTFIIYFQIEPAFLKIFFLKITFQSFLVFFPY